MIDNKTGIVILITTNKGHYSKRYFNSFGKKKRLCTAWSLAGAKVFLSKEREEYKAIVKKLEAKKIRFETVHISTIENEPLNLDYQNHCFAPIMQHFYLFVWGFFDFDIRNLREDFGQPKNNETDQLNISFQARFYMIVSEVITLTKGKDLKNILQKHQGACIDVLEPVDLNGKLPF